MRLLYLIVIKMMILLPIPVLFMLTTTKKEGDKMRTNVKRIFITWFLSVFLIFSMVAGSYAYSGILALGDSLSDNGYYQGYPGGTTGNNNPSDGYGFRRYSNGKVWVEYLAQSLSVPLLDMAYGGATSSWDNPAAYSATGNPVYQSTTGLQWQVNTYAGMFGAISANTLVTVWAGGNDMFNARSPITAAQNIALAIQNLIALGGHSFLIPNLTNSNAWIAAFDPALTAAIAGLRLANPGINFYELDMNNLVLTGIDYLNGSWLGQYAPASCPQNAPTCVGQGYGTYAWWDQVGVHPTTEVHTQIAAYAATRIPEPASIILLILGIAGLAGARRI
jgi:thermolabile hemolysin